VSTEELGKATSNKLYVGLMVAFFGALFLNNTLIPILILAVSALVIVGGLLRSLPQFSGVSEEIYKLQLFLLIASLLVIVFWSLLPSTIPFLHMTHPVADATTASVSRFALALSVILTEGGPVVSTAGAIVALVGLRK